MKPRNRASLILSIDATRDAIIANVTSVNDKVTAVAGNVSELAQRLEMRDELRDDQYESLAHRMAQIESRLLEIEISLSIRRLVDGMRSKVSELMAKANQAARQGLDFDPTQPVS